MSAHRPYDNSQTVADEAAILADFVCRSGQVYGDIPHQRDVIYGLGPRSTLDIFDCPGAMGTVVFIHGGYWQRCDKSDFAYLVPLLLRQRYRCVLLEYDLAPYSRLSDIVGQVGRALDFLHRQSWAGWPLILMGHSAGAHLAACHLSHPAVGAAHLLSGVYDLAPIRDTHLDAALQLGDAEIEYCSPVRMSYAALAPCEIVVGDLELPELQWQSAQFAQYLSHAHPHVPISARVLSRCHHYDILDAYCVSLPDLRGAMIPFWNHKGCNR